MAISLSSTESVGVRFSTITGGLLFLATVSGVGCASHAQHSPGCDLVAAMETVVLAVRTDNMRKLLTVLPKQGLVAITTTIEQPALSERVDSETLAEDLLSRTGFYELIIRSEVEDAFADVFQATEFGDWRAVGEGRFLPPGEDYDDGRTFVRMECMSSGAAIVEIGWPAS